MVAPIQPSLSTGAIDNPTLTGGMYVVKGLYELFNSGVNYDILKIHERQAQIESDNLTLQVEQEANMIREQFLQSVENAKYAQARRGVKVGEGGTAQNIEMSAKDLGKDIQTAKGNVKYKQDLLKEKARGLAIGAEGQKTLSLISGIKDASGSFGTSYKEFMKNKKKPYELMAGDNSSEGIA